MTTSTSLGALTTNLLNSNTFHPTLSITLPRTTIPSSISRASCSANLLINLPSGVFYDPFTASNPIIGSGNGSRGQVVSTSGVELEHAVGWTSRSMRAKARRQWWERSDEDEEESWGGVDLQGLLGAALRRKAQEVKREEEGGEVNLSLDAKKVRIRAKGQMQQRQEFKEERSTVVIVVDDLLSGDGGLFKIQIPLHLRYHPTIDSDANPSFSASLSELFHQLIPSTFTSPSSSPPHLKLTLTHPTLYISCPSSSSTRSPASLLPASHIHLKPLLSRILSSDKVVAHTSTSGTLVLQVPIPPARLLAAVRAVTLITVVGACAAVVGHLLVNIVPMLDAVEKMG
ncbi:Protein PBN1 [Pseudozyma hubeiensis]|nr:Protein PBN1 [Pseudozyma hubeiensis]